VRSSLHARRFIWKISQVAPLTTMKSRYFRTGARRLNVSGGGAIIIFTGVTMGINIRQKGQEGEREIQRALEPIIRKLMTDGGYLLPEKAIVQRNQNQSAVGGSDLSNTFGLAIEVKRQEQLSINTWWKQCETAADDNKEHPVLLYRQNGKKWRCVTLVWLHLPGGMQQQARAEMDWDSFLCWFEQWVRQKLVQGEVPRV
jgi:hypothetical protein